MPIKIKQTLPIYFATNRGMSGPRTNPRFGERFHQDGAQFYRVGTATVSKVSDDLDEGYQIKRIQVEGESSADAQDRGSDRLFGKIRKEINARGCDALVYIHGFANTFEESIARAAQLHEVYQVGPPKKPQHPVVFVFCWPSNGRVTPPWEYFSDRQDAEASGVAMARTVCRLYDFIRREGTPCKQRIHVVAHSMGNWALRHAVQALKGERRLEPIFDNVFLMAADEDDDALERDDKLKPLLDLARRIHVYHSEDDKALIMSNTTKFNGARLGNNGLRSVSGIYHQVIAVDCQAVDDTEMLQVDHQYYRRRDEVIKDVRAVLSGKRPDDIPGRIVMEPGRRYRIQLKNKPRQTTAAKPVSSAAGAQTKLAKQPRRR